MLLPGGVAAPEPLSSFVTRRFSVAFQRGVPEFAVLDHLLTGKGLRSALEAQGEHFAAVGREVSEELWERSASQPISPGPPVPFLARPVPSRARPIPLSVEPAVVRQWYRAFGKSKPAQKESVTTQRRIFSYQR